MNPFVENEEQWLVKLTLLEEGTLRTKIGSINLFEEMFDKLILQFVINANHNQMDGYEILKFIHGNWR